jgi:crotonobetainyl-CoA:carnitine CoA-transferase CaiB-like acyl-CoA transferase
VSLIQAAVSGLANQATNWLVGGHSPQRMGSAHPNIAPYGTPYPTGDGPPLVLAVGTDRQFAALCDIVDRPALADDPRFATNAQRVGHRDALDRILEECFADVDTASLLDALHDRNVPAGVVNDVPAVFDQPTAQKMVLNPENEPAGLRQTAFPHPDDDAASLAPPPHYAEHTTTILRNRLGHSPERINALRERGVIAEA